MAPRTSIPESFEHVLSVIRKSKETEDLAEISPEEKEMRSILQAYFLVNKDVYFIALLERYKKLLNFQEETKPILKIIGLYDGEILMAILSNLPIKFSKITAVDRSKAIINNVSVYIKEKNLDVPHTLNVFDITKAIKSKIEPCDYIFSLWRMHLVKNQALAMKNMYSLLKPSGCVLMSFVVKSVAYEVFNIMANSAKWDMVKEELKSVISPYQDSKYSYEEMFSYLKDAGFIDIDIELINRTYAFDNVENFFEKINLILDDSIVLPDLIKGMFYRDILKEFEYKGYVIRTKNPETILIKMPVEMVNILAVRPKDPKASKPEAMVID